jgi:hypothetical protein
MPARWRVALAAIIAAAIVGGLVPHGVLADAQSATIEMLQIAEAPLAAAPNCLDATCGKGSPSPPAPLPLVALAGILSGLAIAAIVAGRLRRHRSAVAPLPAGVPDPLLHPPQFS